MLVFERPEFADHELIGFVTDPAAGLHALIAIHNTVLGSAAGGVCMQPYAAPVEALSEVPRRSRTMTLQVRACRRTGRRRRRRHNRRPGAEQVGGLARGLRLGRRSLTGLRAAVLGIGSVGWHLCKHLVADGVDVFAADVDEVAMAQAVEAYGVVPVPLDALYRLDADILAPCLESEALTDAAIRELRVKVVCGGADRQLAGDRLGVALADRGILYVPDYVANAGGLISNLSDLNGTPRNAVERRVAAIHETCLRVFARAESEGLSTDSAADLMAREMIAERAVAADRPTRRAGTDLRIGQPVM